MNCKKCYGRGVTYSQPMAGVYQINPCPCEYGMQRQRESEQRLKENRKRIEEAYAALTRSQKETETEENILRM